MTALHWAVYHDDADMAGLLVRSGADVNVENRYGENSHHIVESCFKGLARALRQAIEIDPRKAGAVPSTKGSL